jgi:hypothetical protein
MPNRLVVGLLGLRNSGKSYTWNELFGRTVRTGKHRLELRPGESVETYLIAGSPEERGIDVKSILKNQHRRIVLCSMQYVQGVERTLEYFAQNHFFLYVQWLNPARGRYPVKAFDDLGLTNKILSVTSLLSIRNSDGGTASRVRELREFIYGWARFRRLLFHS